MKDWQRRNQQAAALHDAVVDAAKVVAQVFTGSPATSQHV